MSEVITVRIDFEVNAQQAARDLTDVIAKALYAQRLLRRTLSFLKRISGSEDANRFISLMTRAISLVYTLRVAVVALNAAMAAGPAGWLLAGISVAMLALDVGDLLMDLG